MILIPVDVKIRSTIKTGLVNTISNIEKAKARRKNCLHTLVEISVIDYDELTCESIIDCNSITIKDISELINKLKCGKAKCKKEVDAHIVNKIRTAVHASTVVENYIKQILL